MEEPIKQKKTGDAKAYIREWKRKDYAENGDKIKSKNKAYYYKYKCGLTNDDMEKYDTLLPYVAKIKMSVDEFKNHNEKMLVDYLEGILTEIKEKQISV
jgi:hypothetical protein